MENLTARKNAQTGHPAPGTESPAVERARCEEHATVRTSVPRSSPVILMVDANPGDIRLVEDHFQTSPFASRFMAVEDGEKALAFLRRQGAYADAPRPDLILLDINLPRGNGRDILSEIKTDENLKTIPVIVFALCEDSRELDDSYRQHANCLVAKPFDFEALNEVLTSIERFWLGTAVLPPKSRFKRA